MFRKCTDSFVYLLLDNGTIFKINIYILMKNWIFLMCKIDVYTAEVKDRILLELLGQIVEFVVDVFALLL